MDYPALSATLASLATVIGIAGAAFGVSSLAGAPRKIIPFSGGLLMGIALFGVMPELAESYGWAGGAALLAAGAGVLWVFSHYVYPICPACSHTHDHDQCARVLHGFALPLVIAASLHAFLDGVGISASGQEQQSALATAVVFGVAIHKIPEGVALGIMLRAAVRSRWSAFAWCAVAEATTLAGALFESAVSAYAGSAWISYALALAGGSFIFLGFHAIHGEWRRRGTPAFMPALTGAAGAAALQQGLRVFFR